MKITSAFSPYKRTDSPATDSPLRSDSPATDSPLRSNSRTLSDEQIKQMEKDISFRVNKIMRRSLLPMITGLAIGIISFSAGLVLLLKDDEISRALKNKNEIDLSFKDDSEIARTLLVASTTFLIGVILGGI